MRKNKNHIANSLHCVLRYKEDIKVRKKNKIKDLKKWYKQQKKRKKKRIQYE